MYLGFTLIIWFTLVHLSFPFIFFSSYQYFPFYSLPFYSLPYLVLSYQFPVLSIFIPVLSWH